MRTKQPQPPAAAGGARNSAAGGRNSGGSVVCVTFCVSAFALLVVGVNYLLYTQAPRFVVAPTVRSLEPDTLVVASQEGLVPLRFMALVSLLSTWLWHGEAIHINVSLVYFPLSVPGSLAVKSRGNQARGSSARESRSVGPFACGETCHCFDEDSNNYTGAVVSTADGVPCYLLTGSGLSATVVPRPGKTMARDVVVHVDLNIPDNDITQAMQDECDLFGSLDVFIFFSEVHLDFWVLGTKQQLPQLTWGSLLCSTTQN